MEKTNQTPNTAPTNQTSPTERKANLIRLYSRLEDMKLQHVPPLQSHKTASQTR